MDRAFSSLAVLSLLKVQALDVRRTLIYVVCLVLATAIHEFAHAFSADRLGDPTPSREGRLTLNPLAHADPIGTIALPLFAGLTKAPLFGWGRPVMTQPRYYKRSVSMRAGLALVAFAGPLSNVIQAGLTLLLAWLLALAGLSAASHPSVFAVLGLFAVMNATLAVFNLLPVHPLDGGKVLAWLLPARWQGVDDFLARYGWMILLAFMLTPQLGVVFSPLIGLVLRAMAMIDPAWVDAYLRTF